jgi:phospholipase/lecithinase/hemolysin
MKRLISALLMSFCVATYSSNLSHVVVFGDSLSDNGNLYEYMKHQLPISPPYFEGRFTNGLVWIEHVMQHYYPNSVREHLSNYAFGGSGVSEDNDNVDEDDISVFTLRTEIDSYLLTHPNAIEENSLFVLWMGANNYIATPDDVDEAVVQVNAGIVKQTERLLKHGAKHILIATIPDLGKTPWATDFDLTDIWSDLSIKHNQLLRQQVARLKAKYPDVEWILLEVDDMFNRAMNYPHDYGFTNTQGTCYEAMTPNKPHNALSGPQSMSLFKMVGSVSASSAAVSSDACAGFLFFDPIHPSGKAHELIAKETIALFERLGIQFN